MRPRPMWTSTGPSVYTLSERAAGYHKLTQVFELPQAGHIDVRSEGREPLPVKPRNGEGAGLVSGERPSAEHALLR